MIKSMTGYGKGEAVLYNRKFVVEIKTVNHRYNYISIKMPRVLNPFEDKLRKILTKDILRGKTDVYVTMESFSESDIKIKVNTVLCDSYVEALNALRTRYNLSEEKNEINIYAISKLPDALTVSREINDEEAFEEMLAGLLAATESALKGLISMRNREGESLCTDIVQKLHAISGVVDRVCERAPLVLEEHKQRLRERLNEIFDSPELNEVRLYQEVTFFADKAGIDEEITRLKSHLTQALGILQNEDYVGRKLDFLVQEMNREINTIGSKANDLEIASMVVLLKTEAEKIREQVQNIE